MKNCPYCGRDNFTKISELGNKYLPSDIAICNQCGGCFKFKILSEEANLHYYANMSYLSRGKDPSDEAMENLFSKRVRTLAYPRYHFIRHFTALKPAQGLVVELGANDGANLFPWHENGFPTLGIELDPKVAEFGRRKGLRLLEGDALSRDLDGKKPGLVILSHFLEHVTDADAVLGKISRDLAPGGFLFIEVPGIRAQGLGNPIKYFDAEHNYYFDLAGISRLLKRHSFEIIYGDEYARILCAREESGFKPGNAGAPMSFAGFKAAAAKAVSGMLGITGEKTIDLLRRAAAGDIRIRLFNKMQDIYFRNYYNAITKGQDDEKTVNT